MSRNKKLQELLDRLAGTRGKPNPKEEANGTAKSGRKAAEGCEGENTCSALTDAADENNADNADSADGSDSADSSDSADNADGSDSPDSYERAAMMLGEAMLERVGIPEGINPIAVVVTLLKRMDNEDDNTDGPDSMNAKRNAMLPRPMRGSMGQAPETDYESMSSEDFRKLRRQLKKASMDGRRVRI
ncbi:MAG: hypothetical protein ACI4NQ_02345 [Christensenellales bacterium]